MSFDILTDNDETLSKFEALSKERKALQAKGLLPSWYTTQAWQVFKDTAMVEGEDAYLGRAKTIANTIAKYSPDFDVWSKKFFNLIWDNYLSPASPVFTNTGTNKGMPVSCSGQYVEDSIVSFYDNIKRMALLSKHGFGTSMDFTAVRNRGDKISTGGKALGPIPFTLQAFDTAANVSQGGARRGQVNVYVDIDTPSFDEAIDVLKRHPNGKNFTWTVRDSFIDKLAAGDEQANERFKNMVHTKLLTGKGLVFFVDKANELRPQMYKDLGLDVKASNLCCMTADQRVVTDKGILTVKELYDLGTPNLVVGLDSISKASQMLLPRPNAPIVQIETAEGYRHKVTPDHRVWKKDYGWIEAQHLVEGDKILTQQIEGLFGNKHNPDLALIMGLVAGDGTYTDHSVCIDLWKDKTLQFSTEIEHKVASLIQDQEVNTTSTLTPTFSVYGDKARLSSAPLARVLANEGFTKETKTQVPDLVWKGTKETVEFYLRGLYVTDGHIQSSNEVCSLVLSSVDKALLQDIQILWSNLGVKTSINKMREGGLKDFGKGGIYNTQPCYRLLITSIQGCQIAEKALKLGKFRTGTVADNYNERLTKQGYAQKLYATFTGLTELPNEDAYCLTVDSETHAWTVNGLVTHNTEILLHSSPDYDFSCILSSLNLLHADKMLEDGNTIIFDSMVFLDCLCSYFIEVSEGIEGLEKVREFTIKGRAVGLGVMGLHTYFQSKRIPYASLEAQFRENEIFKHIHDETLRASKWLAEVYGEPDWCKGYGVRNTHRTAIAPTKTSSLMMGGVSEGINPDPGMVFDGVSAKGQLRRITPIFYEFMKEKGAYNEETISSIIRDVGSCRNQDWMTDEEKEIFKNAFEYDQKLLLRRAALRQKWLCQTQSLNFYISEENCEVELSEIMTLCFLNRNIPTQYYVYTRNGVVVQKDECLACHA